MATSLASPWVIVKRTSFRIPLDRRRVETCTSGSPSSWATHAIAAPSAGLPPALTAIPPAGRARRVTTTAGPRPPRRAHDPHAGHGASSGPGLLSRRVVEDARQRSDVDAAAGLGCRQRGHLRSRREGLDAFEAGSAWRLRDGSGALYRLLPGSTSTEQLTAERRLTGRDQDGTVGAFSHPSDHASWAASCPAEKSSGWWIECGARHRGARP